jgi:outer membrane scaffolding protein for murein synthesis (MipA/OmpV family)
MPTIGTLVEIGPVLRINLGPLDKDAETARSTRLDLPVRAVFDLNDDLHHKGWDFEPTLLRTWWRTDRTSFNTTVGLLVGDHQLNDLFYSVDPQFAIPGRPAYQAKGGLISTRVSAGLNVRLSRTLRVYGSIALETVRGAANEDSPLVRQHQDANVGIGLSWGFWQSEEHAAE